MKTKTNNYDKQAFIKLFRENSEQMNGTTRRALTFCLNRLEEGDLSFRDVIVSGFMYSRDYAFLLDLSLEAYDEKKAMSKKIKEIKTLVNASV